ncbi:MAG: hypothetical protein A3H96_06310 [Acidobacteria bacterium RIFCSPLOWO2_02_FULL_67_36]|nr:MAG: hypothetical protein A3H96_06310 [Acidobacteria bacterium RIFCSPLOWO2_02_FULL_67_36]OFW25897.1 MAG: hypothetical protein A3G21_15150 [Acidobacteria bacterium RIFCSPLOWO2_12_FULL_66_21]
MSYLRESLVGLVILLVAFAPTATAQTAIRVTDVAGTTVDLQDVRLDYTDYRFGAVLISQMRELVGVRVSRGGGEITVTWDKIKQITVKDGGGEITPQEGAPITVQFVGGPILRGWADLGRYHLPFAKVARMVVLGPSDYKYSEYRDVDAVVTDGTGTVTQLTKVESLDVALGEGTVSIPPWSLGELNVESVDQATGTTRGVMVRNDSAVKVPAMFRSDAILKGQSDLGPFEIRLSSVRRITFKQQERR